MKRILPISLLIFVVILSACSDNTDKEEEATHDIEENIEMAEETSPEGNDEDISDNEGYEEDTFSESGVFKEQKSAETIDIETDKGITTYQLTEEAQEDVEYLDVGEEVTYTYYEEDDESVIGFIDKSEYYDKPRHHHENHQHKRHHRHQDHHKHQGHHKDRGHHHGGRSN